MSTDHPTGPTHGLFRFSVDDCIAVVPLKRVASPCVKDLEEGSECFVKWTTAGKPLKVVVIALGKYLQECVNLTE